MLRKAAVPMLALLIAVLAGCATSPTGSQAAAMPPADVNGTWTGNLATGATTITLVLKQTGTQVSGNLTGAGTLDGPVDGIVEGNTIRLREAGGYAQTPPLTVKGDQITGFVRGTTLNLRRISK